jgi:putative nucleotidyltransferase with HDIG domain/PAS domain S-box-containing protein
VSVILVVDDHEQNRYLVRAMLAGSGNEVLEAANGSEALDLARRRPPDLIVSDILMPQMDGFALCRECKGDELLRDIPFVFCTATYTDARDEALALSLGAARFVVKPIEGEAFLAVLREVLEAPLSNHTPEPPPAADEETDYYRLYNEALVRKLEDKMLELDRLNRALGENARRLALTIEATNDGMWDWNIATGDIMFSPRYYTMLGYEPDEFPQTHESWRKLVHEADLPTAEQTIDAAMDGGDGYAFEVRLRTKTDGWRWILSRGKVVERDADGRAVRMLGMHSDITELRRAETAAAERSHFLEELLEALPVPVFYKDVTLRYVGCNEAFAQMLGRSKAEVIGKTAFDVYPDALAETFDISDRQLLAQPDAPLENELELESPGHGLRLIVTHKAVFSDVAGMPAGIVGVNLDVTDIRRADMELAGSAARLRETLKAAVGALGATTEMRDPYTAGHQRRVAELACAIAGELGWTGGRIESLRTAALLHDIGKTVVPAELLSKPGRLSETEMLLIRQHAAAGADTVSDIDFEGPVAEAIRQHHERLDGSGYPAGLRDEAILPEARVLAVADVVEAMMSHRPYRPALGLDVTLDEIMKNSGRLYDPAVADACTRVCRRNGFTLGT